MNTLRRIKLKYFPLQFKPEYACIVLTTKCNGRCRMCKISSISPPKELSFQEMKKIVGDLATFGIKHIVLLGGEPLLYKNLWRLAKYIKKKNLTCGLITNGTLITEKNIRKLKENFVHTEISLDGSKKEINDQVRFSGSFEGATRAIGLFKKYKIPFSIRYTIQKDNARDIIGIIKLTEKQQLALLLSFVEISGYGNAPAQKLQSIDINLFKKALNFIEKTKPEFLVNNWEALRFIYQRLKGSTKKIICYSPFTWVPIFADGGVYPCSVIEENLGNILEDPIEKIYFSQKATEIKESILARNNQICNHCLHLCELNESFCQTFSYKEFIKNYLRIFNKNF